MTTNDEVRSGQLVRRIGGALGQAAAAALVAAAVSAIGLYAFSLVQWPAFNSSNVTRALTTVGQVASAVLLIASIVLIRRKSALWPAKLLSWAGISAFVTVTLGMPLAATKLYLFGVSVDQEFRTEYLTRLTDSAALRDMTYADLPPFYPAGWFWIGGRVANVLGMDGWEVFKPYAIASIAVAAVISLVLWSELIRADWAVAVTAAVTAFGVAYASPEAYGAVIAVLLPPVLVLAWGALHRPADQRGTAGGWGAVIGTGLFLGVAATFYTLYLAFAAFAVTLMALVAAGYAVWARRAQGHSRRRAAVVARTSSDSSVEVDRSAPKGGAWRAAISPITRLIVIGAIAGLIALTVYLPFLLELLGGTWPSGGTAFHYLPEAGAELPFPMVEFSLRGGFCLIGTIWLVLRAGSSRRAQALGIGVLAVYLWSLLSMLATVAGTTLLSFRLEPILLVLLAAAGAFGFVEGARAAYQAFNEPERFRIVAVVVALVGALAFTQDIPRVLAPEITTAYTDTDGDGVRADQRDPSAVAYYREIDAALTAQTGRPRSETVLLTADTTFLAYYPYFGFQGLTSHYANPLAEFGERAAAIEAWSELESPQELLDAMASAPWRAPDAFLFRRSGEDYTLRLAKDVYPNDPNVSRYTVAFPASLFDDPGFTSTDIGPFTLVTVAR
ncbi:galactan 5-O-arabinofuranosyltransferase [Nocardia cyriacigeorgica]|uniref:galactan 5-O-arabinofuranosyltransferase n=1 Tax=Nocardia cyriacigeorgica TaxID=135487 RepID=UPI0018958F64|nr:galactan 5-O-arabinofuranosyltransferase [Nocardia cyriacigeorgica]MBF6086224.1 galactan 5-O-arabinofuranosyltransferase [Nocardia cyriacigeorgica]MBF6396908.1 galactan 5-O-arabinofuranosyltransferase [Nocardia cyriacigeorgica]MBF6403434.1 galactan 5-O-arabinofuranosyltransferase [Nocardia cyriacigeorgica]